MMLFGAPSTNITKKGFVNTLEGMVRNTNYEVINATEYKDEGTVNELHGVITYKTSLPMKKDGINFSNIFSPNLMVRYAPRPHEKFEQK